MDIAEELLRAKLALEAELLRPLETFATRYVEALEQTGGAIGAHERSLHAARLEAILLRHYSRVVMVVTGRRPPRDPALRNAALSLLHQESLMGRAKDQVSMILNSLDREFAKEVARLSNVPAVTDGTDNYESKAAAKIVTGYIGKIKAAAANVLGKFKSKLGAVSNVNTNGVAEEARSIQVVPDEEANGYIEQEWHNVGDERVRGNPAGIYARSKFDHWSCEGQVRRVSEPFEISGESLRFPGDGKTASLGNIINCRCYLTTYFVHNDGRRELLHTGPSAPTRSYGKRPAAGAPKLNPTSVVTLNGKTRARVVLGDGSLATLRQQNPNLITVSINGKPIARAVISKTRSVRVTVDPKFRGRGIEDLIRRSVRHSDQMDRRPHAERVP